MPNWCMNILIIEGHKEEREEFVSKIKPVFIDWGHKYKCLLRKASATKDVNERRQLLQEAKNLRKDSTYTSLLHVHYPVPEDIVIKGYDDIGYDWCIKHWGTKWDACDLDISKRKECVVATFLTPWSPPIQAIVHISKSYPDLTFFLGYYEAGYPFCGYTIWKDGEEKDGVKLSNNIDCKKCEEWIYIKTYKSIEQCTLAFSILMS